MKIVCKNENEEIMEFGYTWPYWLETAQGLYSAESDITTVNNAMTDGELYSGITTKRRNIVLTIKVKQRIIRNYEQNISKL